MPGWWWRVAGSNTQTNIILCGRWRASSVPAIAPKHKTCKFLADPVPKPHSGSGHTLSTSALLERLKRTNDAVDADFSNLPSPPQVVQGFRYQRPTPPQT